MHWGFKCTIKTPEIAIWLFIVLDVLFSINPQTYHLFNKEAQIVDITVSKLRKKFCLKVTVNYDCCYAYQQLKGRISNTTVSIT